MIDASKKEALTEFVGDCERLLVRVRAARQDLLAAIVERILDEARAALIDAGREPPNGHPPPRQPPPRPGRSGRRSRKSGANVGKRRAAA
jgi:hypothetical protein